MLNKLIIFITLVSISLTSLAKAKPVKKSSTPYQPIQASLIIEANTKKVLHAHNSKVRIYPASLTKMMTAYLAFEALEKGKISPNTDMEVSPYAASARPGKLGLQAGDTIKFHKAVIATIVKSANDTSRVIAEKLGGSEPKFAQMMNAKAKQLGMMNTHFRNSSGWPDPKQQSTAEDLVKLSLALKRDFPQYYNLFSATSFMFRGKVYQGHNYVTKHYPGADGIKTGFVCASGFNVVTSAKRNGKHLIAVVLGGKTAKERDQKMIALLDKHFENKAPGPVMAQKHPAASKKQKITTKVALKKSAKDGKKVTWANKSSSLPSAKKS
jgi:D-alanyl-D-alanine carboxypeptidase (penicillin-binding protein 5/6)